MSNPKSSEVWYTARTPRHTRSPGTLRPIARYPSGQATATNPNPIQRFTLKKNLSNADRSISRLSDQITSTGSKLNEPSDKDTILLKTSRICPFDQMDLKCACNGSGFMLSRSFLLAKTFSGLIQTKSPFGRPRDAGEDFAAATLIRALHPLLPGDKSRPASL
jgi:hypothetical protein